MRFLTAKTGMIFGLLLGGAIILYFAATGAFGGTQIGITLKTGGVVDDGLVAHWTFDGDLENEVTDYVGTNNVMYFGSGGQGTSSVVAAGRIGQGVHLDGSTDYIESFTTSGVVRNVSVASIAAWIRADSISTEQVIVDIARGTDTSSRLELGVNYIDDGEVRLAARGTDAEALDNTRTTSDPITAGNWHHVVGLVDYANDNIDIYVDGELQPETSAIGVNSPTSDTDPTYIMIGADDSGTSRFFDGAIDDVRIYHKLLTAEEISRIYELGATTKIAKTVDSNTGGALQDGLVLHFTFDGESIDPAIEDVSGTGNDGVYTSIGDGHTTTTAPGVIGQAFSYDGVDEWIQVPDDASIDGLSELTMAGWMRINSGTGNEFPQLIVKQTSTSGSDGYWIGTENTGGICTGTHTICAQINVGGDQDTLSSNEINYDQWYHMAATYDGAMFRLYVDGVEVDSSSQTGTIDSSSQPLCIGAYNNAAATTCNDVEGLHDGLLDDVRIYNRGLSADEVRRLYELGATTKIAKSINFNPDLDDGLVAHWTFDGDAPTEIPDLGGSGSVNDTLMFMRGEVATSVAVIPGVIGQGMSLDGAAHYLWAADSADFDSIESSENFTMGGWINITGTFGAEATLMSHGQNYEVGTIYVDDDFDPLEICYGGANNGVNTCPASLRGAMDYNEWYHLMLTYDQVNMRMYFNGEEVHSTAETNAIPSETEDFCVGASHFSSTCNNALAPLKVDDIRVYNRALSADEVRRVYQLGGQ